MANIEVTNPSLNISVMRQTPTLAVSTNLAYVGSPTFTFNQASPSATWNITHSLDRYPAVSVVDSAGTVVIGEVQYIDSNNLIVRFSSAFAGKAYLN